jgi:hypothetical protein
MKEEIIQAYKEYIDVLNDEINDLIGIAHVHGFKSRNIVRGELARKKIVDLLNKKNDDWKERFSDECEIMGLDAGVIKNLINYIETNLLK